METIYDLWSKRNPEWELRYDDLIKTFTDYGKGATQYQQDRGKMFGAGYEIYILAFFIGLYNNRTKPLIEDKNQRKSFGHAIVYWGNQENRLNRNSYGQIKDYIFAALVARTNIDFIALDKGEITSRKVVDLLIQKMEEYANFGFDYIQEQLEINPNHFFNDTTFLRLFMSFIKNENNDEEGNKTDNQPEALD